MKKLIIVAGATGVGKTSFIGAIKPHYDALNILYYAKRKSRRTDCYMPATRFNFWYGNRFI